MTRPPHILCYAPYTAWSIHGARQITILQALRVRGCSVSYVTCDAAFTDCDIAQHANGATSARRSNSCLTCQSSVAARLAAWSMPYRWLGRWPTTMTLIFALSLTLSVTNAQLAEGAQCVNVLLLDANGAVVPTEKPVTGLMVGGVPAVSEDTPEHVARTAGADAPCPQDLVDQVTNLFSESCTTSERRTAAAQTHGVSVEVIKKGCRDMSAALSEYE